MNLSRLPAEILRMTNHGSPMLGPHNPLRRHAATIALLAGAAVLLWPKTALANAGIPMIFLVWPASWVVFVPVVLVEAVVAQRVLGLPTRDAIKLSLVANAWSTLAGIPITWAVLAVLEMSAGLILARVAGGSDSAANPLMVLLYAPWLPPVKASWILPAAGAVLCVPFFFASVWIEARSAGRRVPAAKAMGWARRANAATYGFFLVLLLLAALISRLTQAGSAG